MKFNKIFKRSDKTRNSTEFLPVIHPTHRRFGWKYESIAFGILIIIIILMLI